MTSEHPATPAFPLHVGAGVPAIQVQGVDFSYGDKQVLKDVSLDVPTNEVVDIYSAKSWLHDALLQPETRAAWRRLLDQGWTDAILKLHPGEPMYTYWDYFRNRWERNAGLRIDHLLLNAPAAAALQGAGIDREVRGREKPSDHAPAWVVLGT